MFRGEICVHSVLLYVQKLCGPLPGFSDGEGGRLFSAIRYRGTFFCKLLFFWGGGWYRKKIRPNYSTKSRIARHNIMKFLIKMTFFIWTFDNGNHCINSNSIIISNSIINSKSSRTAPVSSARISEKIQMLQTVYMTIFKAIGGGHFYKLSSYQSS